jgi:hypothetical protein
VLHLLTVNLLNCPWTNWELPTLVFCEDILCAWIRTSANSWSNISFVIVGLVIYFIEQRKKNKELQGYGLMAIAVGCLSFFCHASVTRYGEIADLGSMFLIGIFLDRINMERIGWLTPSQGRLFSWIGNILSTGLLFWIKDLGAPLFFVQCMFALGLEVTLKRRGKGALTYKYFMWGFYSWIIAQTIWFLDLKRIVCYPHNHWIQGHAVWHVLMSLLTWFIYKHYAQPSLARRTI